MSLQTKCVRLGMQVQHAAVEPSTLCSSKQHSLGAHIGLRDAGSDNICHVMCNLTKPVACVAKARGWHGPPVCYQLHGSIILS